MGLTDKINLIQTNTQSQMVTNSTSAEEKLKETPKIIIPSENIEIIAKNQCDKKLKEVNVEEKSIPDISKMNTFIDESRIKIPLIGMDKKTENVLQEIVKHEKIIETNTEEQIVKNGYSNAKCDKNEVKIVSSKNSIQNTEKILPKIRDDNSRTNKAKETEELRVPDDKSVDICHKLLNNSLEDIISKVTDKLSEESLENASQCGTKTNLISGVDSKKRTSTVTYASEDKSNKIIDKSDMNGDLYEKSGFNINQQTLVKEIIEFSSTIEDKVAETECNNHQEAASTLEFSDEVNSDEKQKTAPNSSVTLAKRTAQVSQSFISTTEDKSDLSKFVVNKTQFDSILFSCNKSNNDIQSLSCDESEKNEQKFQHETKLNLQLEKEKSAEKNELVIGQMTEQLENMEKTKENLASRDYARFGNHKLSSSDEQSGPLMKTLRNTSTESQESNEKFEEVTSQLKSRNVNSTKRKKIEVQSNKLNENTKLSPIIIKKSPRNAKSAEKIKQNRELTDKILPDIPKKHLKKNDVKPLSTDDKKVTRTIKAETMIPSKHTITKYSIAKSANSSPISKTSLKPFINTNFSLSLKNFKIPKKVQSTHDEHQTPVEKKDIELSKVKDDNFSSASTEIQSSDCKKALEGSSHNFDILMNGVDLEAKKINLQTNKDINKLNKTSNKRSSKTSNKQINEFASSPMHKAQFVNMNESQQISKLKQKSSINLHDIQPTSNNTSAITSSLITEVNNVPLLLTNEADSSKVSEVKSSLIHKVETSKLDKSQSPSNLKVTTSSIESSMSNDINKAESSLINQVQLIEPSVSNKVNKVKSLHNNKIVNFNKLQSPSQVKGHSSKELLDSQSIEEISCDFLQNSVQERTLKSVRNSPKQAKLFKNSKEFLNTRKSQSQHELNETEKIFEENVSPIRASPRQPKPRFFENCVTNFPSRPRRPLDVNETSLLVRKRAIKSKNQKYEKSENSNEAKISGLSKVTTLKHSEKKTINVDDVMAADPSEILDSRLAETLDSREVKNLYRNEVPCLTSIPKNVKSSKKLITDESTLHPHGERSKFCDMKDLSDNREKAMCNTDCGELETPKKSTIDSTFNNESSTVRKKISFNEEIENVSSMVIEQKNKNGKKVEEKIGEGSIGESDMFPQTIEEEKLDAEDSNSSVVRDLRKKGTRRRIFTVKKQKQVISTEVTKSPASLKRRLHVSSGDQKDGLDSPTIEEQKVKQRKIDVEVTSVKKPRIALVKVSGRSLRRQSASPVSAQVQTPQAQTSTANKDKTPPSLDNQDAITIKPQRRQSSKQRSQSSHSKEIQQNNIYQICGNQKSGNSLEQECKDQLEENPAETPPDKGLNHQPKSKKKVEKIIDCAQNVPDSFKTPSNYEKSKKGCQNNALSLSPIDNQAKQSLITSFFTKLPTNSSKSTLKINEKGELPSNKTSAVSSESLVMQQVTETDKQIETMGNIEDCQKQSKSSEVSPAKLEIPNIIEHHSKGRGKRRKCQIVKDSKCEDNINPPVIEQSKNINRELLGNCQDMGLSPLDKPQDLNATGKSSRLRKSTIKTDEIEGQGLSEAEEDEEKCENKAKTHRRRTGGKRGRRKGGRVSPVDEDYEPRKRTDTKSVQPSISSSPKGKNVKCAKCQEEMSTSNWSRHNLQKHNNMGWREDEERPDFENETVLKRILNKTKKRKSTLICESCNEGKKSVIGFISHITFCGKSNEEKYSLMWKCPTCQAVFMPSSREYHERMHIVENEEASKKILEQSQLTEGRGKRQAAQKAVTKILQFTDQVKDGEEPPATSRKLSSKIHKFIQFPSTAKRIPSVWKGLWSKSLLNGQPAHCRQPGCKFSTNDLQEMYEHHSTCSFTPGTALICKICKYLTANKDEIEKHINEEHSSEIGAEDSDFNASEASESDGEHEVVKEATGPKTIKTKAATTQMTKYMSAKNPVFIKNAPSISTVNPTYVLALRWTVEFQQKHYRLKLFDDLPINTFNLVKSPDSYLPELKISLKTAHRQPKVKPQDTKTWRKWKRFEADVVDNVITIFTGGPIWALAWLPIPVTAYKNQANQYLAISTHPTMKATYEVGQSYAFKNSIQIWTVGPLEHGSFDLKVPELAYMVAHEGGTVWALEWCPSGTYHEDRMGLLAAAMSSGHVYIYSLPFPEKMDLPKPTDGPKVVHTDPVMVLHVSPVLEDEAQVMCLNWSKTLNHNILVAGFSNGFVAMWDLSTKSQILKRVEGRTIHLDAVKHFYAHGHAVMFITIVPLGDKRYLATAGMDRSSKLWDLEGVDSSIWCVKKGIAVNGVWMTHWPTMLTACDDALGYKHTQSYLGAIRDNPTNVLALLPTNSPCFATAASDWANGMCHGSQAGEIVAIFPPQLLHLKELDKACKKRWLVSNVELVDLKIEEEKTDTDETREYTYGPDKYNECTERFGVVFYDDLENKRGADWFMKNDRKAFLNPDTMQSWPVEQYPFASVNRIAWNSNAWSYLWMAAGYQNGLVRILCLNKISNNSIMNDLLSQHAEFMMKKEEQFGVS